MHIYKRLIICLIVLSIPLVSAASWKFNPYTGKLDYYETGTVMVYTVATLPGGPVDGQPAIVTDGADAADCTVGGGVVRNPCLWDDNASTWVIAGDGAGSGDSFSTMNAPSGTDPVASGVDTLNFAVVGPITITGDSGTDTLTFEVIVTETTHELGGLEADVSAYDGLLRITAGATSEVTVTANSLTILGDTYAQMRGHLDLEAGTDFYNIAASDAADTAAIDAISWSADLSGTGTSPQVVESGVDHDSLANYFSDEHIDWTLDQGATNINVNNIDLSAVYEPIGVTESDVSDLGTTVYLKTALDSTSEIGAIMGWSANVQSLLDAANYAAIKTQLDTDDIQTLTGIAAGTANLGTFTGSTISDSTTVKAGMQELETALEGVAGGHDAVTIASGITGLTLSTQELSLHAYIEDLAEFTDPNADEILFWDDSAGVVTGLTPTTNVFSITGTAITLANHADARAAIGIFTDSAGFAAQVDDETGTGAAVLATSPTLITPTLGAASATSITLTGGQTANGGFEIDNIPDTDETCQGTTTRVTAGQDTITIGMVVGQNTSGKFVAANADKGSTQIEAVGIACETADTDDALVILLEGFYRDETDYDLTGKVGNSEPKIFIVLDDVAGQMILTDGDLLDNSVGSLPATTDDLDQTLGYPWATGTYEVIYFKPEINSGLH